MAKKTLKGKVVSAKMNKTVVVEVEALREFPKYKRKYKFHKKYKVHDEEKKCRQGDKVVIEETRPYSKEKRWRVVRIEPREEGEGEEEKVEENTEDIKVVKDLEVSKDAEDIKDSNAVNDVDVIKDNPPAGGKES